MTLAELFHVLGLTVVISPALLVTTLGLPALTGWRLSETTQANLTRFSVLVGLLAAVAILILMLSVDTRYVPIEVGNWVSIEDEEFHFFFHFKFIFDRLSVPFAILSFVLCGTVGAFASKYLHREWGYGRFFLLYSLFLFGMIVSSIAGTIETLFFGWEMVGLSSALLVAYFHERPAPVRNGLRIWSIYRISDAAFLIGALTLHHMTGLGDFAGMTGSGNWPEGTSTIDARSALFVGLLLLFAAAGKSGMVPFSGWLPRAMEGPTPSSAIFYGALSVHLGTYLLLRVSPLIAASLTLQFCVILLGLISALYGALTSRVQSDVKNALAFACLTQVGIITIEIGLGWYYIALIHTIGHATLRTLQLLRAPSVLRDYQALENAVGQRLTTEEKSNSWKSSRWQIAVYLFALERGYLDALLNRFVVRPFVAIFQFFDKTERNWTELLTHEDSRASDQVAPYGDSLEEVL